ncbi:MAG: signal peptide peptidase SppA [Methanobacterium sp. ERen5]|nr:MAG: signal peptide peptidase SppA [Methanobacterium sp. ERen5]
MKKNSKIVTGILVGGSLLVIILLTTMISLLGGSNFLSSAPNGDTVAIIPLQGEIGYGSSGLGGESIVTPENVKDALKQAESDGTVSSILIKINSPGGSPVASEEIMNAINESKKPVVVWIGDTGASGAYLAASSADDIIASPSSMVGSIGVIMGLTDLSKYYQNNGIDKYSIKAGEYKDMGSDYRPLTSNERSMLQSMVNEDYSHFIDIVAVNRNLTVNYTQSIAEGKIYTGTQAKNLKLVNDTGGEKQALDATAKLGGITGSYNTIDINPSSGLLDILNSMSSRIAYSIGLGIGNNLKNGTDNDLKLPSIY